LKLCDIDGVVDMTHEAISRRTNVPIEIIRRGIDELEKPDPKSRNAAHEGRRIVRLDEHRDWGWLIVNYQHYRQIASEEQRREKTRLRTQKWRKDNELPSCDAPVTHGDACDAMQRQRKKQMKKKKEPPKSPVGGQDVNGAVTAEQIYNEYPLKVGKQAALKAIERCFKTAAPEVLLERTKQFSAARNGDLDYCPHPTTWFNQGRFNDDPATWARKREVPPVNPASQRIGLEAEEKRLVGLIESLNQSMQYEWDRTPERVKSRKEARARLEQVRAGLSKLSK
ncbi:MAG TPA: hypothetical protein VFU31_30420, partial [Candidatus Binatia bacterium]|nr:hypothetical protein [Candidatus Binatia bacterium]